MMEQPVDLNQTADFPLPRTNALEAVLSAAFGAPRSRMGNLRPVLLKEADGDSADIVKPKSDAMPPPEQTGDRYQLQGEIARGGMGAVLRGRDVDLGRDLAVKVLLEKYVNRPDVARRFVEEAQIGGQLQHPGVVPIYDIGRFGERPFFTMKLVKGQTLAALLSERIDPAADRPRFLAIALQVAQTIAYAHAKGVIHRDLKPANIMVGAFGEVQVMDWGLAKVLAEGGIADEERTASRDRQQPENVTTIRTARSSGTSGSFGTDTEAGSLLGTPAYMPPEQANGDIANLDRRADVFGLGAILCEILTGNAPYVGRSAEEVRRKACNGDLADAMSRLDGCWADAELISLTKSCLAAEAIDRPKDAQAVAEALQIYLDGVQERLHQAELAEAEAKAKAVEEAKRRRLTLALAATVLLVLTLGSGGWLWIKADRDARRTALARDVNDALNQATALREQAKAASASPGARGLFAQAREQLQRAVALVENGPADEALTARVQSLRSDLDEEEKDRQLLAALEAAQMAQTETVTSENRFASERGLPILRQAFQAYGLAPGEGDAGAAAAQIRARPAPVRDALIAALVEWVDLATIERLGIVEPHLNWLRAVEAAAEGPDGWARRLRAAWDLKDNARRRDALEKLAVEVLDHKLPSRLYSSLALRLFVVKSMPSTVRVLRRAQEHYPADFWINEFLGVALEESKPRQLDEAVRFKTAALALRPDSAGAHLNLGNTLFLHHRLDEAVACYRRAVQIDPKYVAAHYFLGERLRERRQVEEAIACYRRAIAVNPKYAVAHAGLGTALAEMGKVEEAIACLQSALEILPQNGDLHDKLGCVLARYKHDLAAALVCFQRAVELEPGNARAHYNLGRLYEEIGRIDDGFASYRKALDLEPNAFDHNINIGVLLCDRKHDYDGAIACFRAAIEADPNDPRGHDNLGIALTGKGQVEEAIAHHRKAIEVDAKYAPARINLGVLLRNKGDWDEAIACFRKANEIDPKAVRAYFELGVILNNIKRDHGGAMACFKRLIELKPDYPMAQENLGVTFCNVGQVDEAITCFRAAIALDPTNDKVRSKLARAERLAAVRTKLPALQNGSYSPAGDPDWLALVDWCQIKRIHRTATNLYATAFAADPKLADDLEAGHRYSAVCFAALAAAGRGNDAAQLDDKERANLRKQALDWLRADLAARTKQFEGGKPADRAEFQEEMKHWQQDRDLAGIRDKDALAKLPVEERAACEKLWADVAALLTKAKAPVKEEK